MHMVFEGGLAVKIDAKDVEVSTSSDRNPRQTKSQWGWFTVLDILTTEALVLLGFNIMHQ